MSGHVMHVVYDPRWESVWLTVECQEPDNADCHSEPESCDAAEWFVDDVVELCTSKVEFPMYDGMPITVQRDDKEGWTWNVDLGSEAMAQP